MPYEPGGGGLSPAAVRRRMFETENTVMVWRLVHGQWMIWSAARVITGHLTRGRQKLRDRIAGALVGVPAGIGAAILLPHSAFAYDLALLIAC